MCRRLTHQARLVVARPFQQVASLCRRFLLLIRLMVFPSTNGIRLMVFVVPRASQPPVPASSAPSLFDSSLVPSTSSPTLAPSVRKAFVAGSRYAPIPGKLVAKITSGTFVELEDLLAENIREKKGIVALGFFWTNRGSEDSEETWATFCTLWSREVRF